MNAITGVASGGRSVRQPEHLSTAGPHTCQATPREALPRQQAQRGLAISVLRHLANALRAWAQAGDSLAISSRLTA